MCAYSRRLFIRGWALVKFSPFSASVVCLFCNKTINGNNKTQNETKKGFCKMINTVMKTPSSRKFVSKGCVLVVGAYLSLSERGRGWALINFFRL